jgi:hypothetical protein
VTGDRDDDPQERPWHERTSTVVGASVAGLAVIGILFLLVSYVARDDAPDQAPQYFIDEPTGSSRISSSSATTTTETVTSTSPPVTTDINPGDQTTTSSPDTSTTESPTTDAPATRPTRTTYDGPSTSRSRPRLNETRTLYPRP